MYIYSSLLFLFLNFFIARKKLFFFIIIVWHHYFPCHKKNKLFYFNIFHAFQTR